MDQQEAEQYRGQIVMNTEEEVRQVMTGCIISVELHLSMVLASS